MSRRCVLIWERGREKVDAQKLIMSYICVGCITNVYTVWNNHKYIPEHSLLMWFINVPAPEESMCYTMIVLVPAGGLLIVAVKYNSTHN